MSGIPDLRLALRRVTRISVISVVALYLYKKKTQRNVQTCHVTADTVKSLQIIISAPVRHR